MKAIFRQFTERVSLVAGTPWAFITALAVILGWGAPAGRSSAFPSTGS